MLASTMWIAGSQCQALVDQILKIDINEIQKAHEGIDTFRKITDWLWLFMIAAIYASLLWLHISVKPSEDTRLGGFLGLVGDVGFTWFALILWRVWVHFFSKRPYGTNPLQFARFAWRSFRESL